MKEEHFSLDTEDRRRSTVLRPDVGRETVGFVSEGVHYGANVEWDGTCIRCEGRIENFKVSGDCLQSIRFV